LGGLLAEHCRTFKVNFPKNFVVIPLPLHKNRKRIRGFNQAELIAVGFISAVSSSRLILEPNLLVRTKNTKPQVELSGEERRQNIVGAFAVSDPNVVKNKTILLVDDVKTTGATLEEAARVLKEAGAKRVWAMTAAH
jgi:ComF family protein